MKRIVTGLRQFRHRKDGVSAVEFAIVLPLFLLILFGIIVFGSYLSLVHSVQQLAAEAARASIGGLSDTERVALATSNIRTQANFYPFIAPDKLLVESAVTDAGTNTFTVRLRYDASQSFIYSLPNLVPMPPPQIVRSAAIQRGGY